MTMLTNRKPARSRKTRGAGCLLPLAWWLVLSVGFYIVSIGEPVTGSFSNRDARLFSIADIDRSGETPEYRRISLETYRERGAAAATSDYRLPEPEVRLDYGDIDVIRVIEETDGVQLIEYHHNNTAYIKSIYRAGEAGIDAVSVQVISNVGVAWGIMLMVFPAWFLAWLTGLLWRRRTAASHGD